MSTGNASSPTNKRLRSDSLDQASSPASTGSSRKVAHNDSPRAAERAQKTNIELGKQVAALQKENNELKKKVMLNDTRISQLEEVNRIQFGVIKNSGLMEMYEAIKREEQERQNRQAAAGGTEQESPAQESGGEEVDADLDDLATLSGDEGSDDTV